MPEGWRWERLGNLVEKSSAKHQPDKESRLPFVGLEHIPPHEMRIEGVGNFAEMRSAGSAFLPGDVLYGRLRPYLNKVWVADRAGACSGELLVLRPKAEMDARYVALNLHSQRYVYYASHIVTGDRPRIDFDLVGAFPVPVPAEDTQRQVVARIDALFAEIDEGEAALAEARAGVETYRKSLLKAAVTGELTADWRAEQIASGRPQETGEQLLQRILADRRARWHADPKNARKKYIEPPRPDANGLPKLPEGWVWASLEQLTIQIRNGLSTKPTEQVGGVPILRISAVRPLEIIPNQVRLLPPGSDVQGFQVSRGDLIAARYSGSPQFVGAVAKFRDADPIAYPDKLIRLQMWTDDQEQTDFVEVAANCGQSRRFIEGNIKTTAGQHGIAGGSLAMTPIPVPPKEEASEIMRRVRQANGAIPADIGIHQLESATSTLRQSILAAAFRGELAA